MNTNSLKASLDSLHTLSLAFEALAADPKNYNNSLAPYLDQMSFEMRKMKSEVLEHMSYFGGF